MQGSLLEVELPDGFLYCPNFVTAAEEQALLEAIKTVEFSAVVMRGAVARRRTAHFGWTYGYDARTTSPGAPIPAFLHEVRQRAAEWMGVAAETLAEALLTEYPPGAPIGWHRDAPMFGDIAGISLGSSCRMKFRPYVSPAGVTDGKTPRRTTHELELAARSAYLITGSARRDFEHSIPAVAGTRYSITFRTVRNARRSRRSSSWSSQP